MVKLPYMQLMKITISILYVRSNNSSHQMVLYRPMDMHWTQRPPQPKPKVIVSAPDFWVFGEFANRIFYSDEVPFHFIRTKYHSTNRIFNTDEVPFFLHSTEPERPEEWFQYYWCLNVQWLSTKCTIDISQIGKTNQIMVNSVWFPTSCTSSAFLE